MKTIKQKLLHSKFAVIAVFLFAFILLISGGFVSKKVSAEEPATFAETDFVMCNGAEVRTDGEKSGIRFVASLGKALPNEADYPNLKYYVMIVPNVYMQGITENYYTELTEKYGYIATMETKPFYSNEVVKGEEGNYIRGTLSNVKYENINVEWFGMAYMTYDVTNEETQEVTTEYLYAQIPEAGANVRSLVYCASGYLNLYDYSSEEKAAEKAVLTDFVAQGINQKAGVAKENKSDTTYLENGIKALENTTATVNLFPGDTTEWTTGVPNGVNLHVVYGTEKESYATYENGVITGVAGDNSKDSTANVTMKVLGETYTRPVHVYTVKAELSVEATEIFSKAGTFGDTTFANSAVLTVTATVDGEEQAIDWAISDNTVAGVNDTAITANEKTEYFESEEVTFSFSFEFANKTFTADECSVKVSFPIAYKNNPLAYGDLFQQKFNESNVLGDTLNEIDTAKLGNAFGAVTSFLGEDGTELIDKDNKLNANKYAKNQAGEKKFTVFSENGYGYMVNATVVSYAINDAAQLTAFFDSYESDTAVQTDETAYTTYGTYVILSDNIETSDYAPRCYYAGTLDGRGHTITYTGGAYGGSKNSTSQGYLGLALTTGGTIKNTAFLGLKVGGTQSAGLTKVNNGVIDNCYIEVEYTADKAMGAVCYRLYGQVENTIVKVTTSANYTVGSLLPCTICYANDYAGEEDNHIENCFSIGVEGKVTASINKGYDNDPNLAFNADGLKALIGTGLPEGYNSAYWTLTESGLTFGVGEKKVTVF